jgi:hypothetical protein
LTMLSNTSSTKISRRKRTFLGLLPIAAVPGVEQGYCCFSMFHS